MTAPINLDAIRAEFLTTCGPCDLAEPYGCTCSDQDYRPTMAILVGEVERLRAGQADTVRAVADKIDRMARVGGSPRMDEALAAAARFVRRLAGDVAAGSTVLDAG